MGALSPHTLLVCPCLRTDPDPNPSAKHCKNFAQEFSSSLPCSSLLRAGACDRWELLWGSLLL